MAGCVRTAMSLTGRFILSVLVAVRIKLLNFCLRLVNEQPHRMVSLQTWNG